MVIVAAAVANQIAHLWIDPLYWLGTAVLAVSAALFGLWMRGLPGMIEHDLYGRCTQTPEGRARFKELLEEARTQLTSNWRFLPIGLGLAVSLTFIGVMSVWDGDPLNVWRAVAWSLGLLPWGWMLGAAGSVVFGVASLIRSVGEAGLLKVLPEHPDGCGGLKSVSMSIVKMVSPMLIVIVLLGFTSIDPKLAVPESVFRIYKLKEPEAVPPDTQQLQHIPAPETGALERQVRSEVGTARVELLKKECSALDVGPRTDSYANCIQRIVEVVEATAEVPAKASRKIWNPRIVPFARVGLLFLIVAIGVCFFWPLGSLHVAMVKARDKKGQELARRLDEVEEEFKAKLDVKTLQDAASLSEHLEKVRKEVLQVRRHPVWPFDAAAVSKVAIPQLLALGSTLVGLLSDWLVH